MRDRVTRATAALEAAIVTLQQALAELQGVEDQTDGITPEQFDRIRRAVRKAGPTASPMFIRNMVRMNRTVVLAGLRQMYAEGMYSGFKRKPLGSRFRLGSRTEGDG